MITYEKFIHRKFITYNMGMQVSCCIRTKIQKTRNIYGELKKEIGLIIRELCRRKEVEIIEAEACKDHIHLLVSIPPKMSISSFMGYLKGKSSLIIFERHANLKYKYGNRVFWAKGYFVSTVGKNKKKIEEYIRNQIKEDMINDQMTIKEYIDPFKGQRVKKSRLSDQNTS